jgi:type IX secretion system PorP/SprF family membrane protein
MLMNGRKLLIFLSVLLSVQELAGQETVYGPGYQTIMITNPAFAGSEADGTLRISYLNFYPGRNYNLHSFFASYDQFIPIIHGGAAAFLTNDYMGGTVNDMRGGFSYSYHMQADKNLFINAGLNASFFHRGFNMNNMIFPDQIDALGGVVYQSSEQMNIKGKTVFDVGAGFLMIAGRFTGGLSVNHLTAPDLSADGVTEQRLNREVTLHLSGLFNISKDKKIYVRPLGYGYFQRNTFLAGAGSTLETNLISLNAMVLTNKSGDIDIQVGLFLHRGAFSFFYNYFFNVSSGNNLLPASLVHNTGIIVSLNNVDKRKIIKTINFPKC